MISALAKSTASKAPKPWLVYVLKGKRATVASARGGTELTYCGATVDLARRLRQHNGEIAGGAKYTKIGKEWKVVFTVEGFREQREALQFEWALKHRVISTIKVNGIPKRKRRKRRSITRAPGKRVNGRVANLMRVFSLPRWTKQSPLASEVPLILTWYDAPVDRPASFEVPPDVKEKLAREDA